MSAKTMANFVDLIKTGHGGKGQWVEEIDHFNNAIKKMVAQNPAKEGSIADIIDLGKKYKKHPRFQRYILSSGVIVTGLLGDLLAKHAEILTVAAESNHYERALRALDNGDLHRAQMILIGDGDSLYNEILDQKGSAVAALNFRAAVQKIFAAANKRR